MTLSQWAESNRQTVFNVGPTPYVLLPEWPHQLPTGECVALYHLDDYSVEEYRGDSDFRACVWLRKREGR